MTMLQEAMAAAKPVIPPEFFTLQSMLTLTGAAGATFIVCNALQSALNFNPRWLGLLVAQIVVWAGAILSHTGGMKPGDYFVALINGFLVYVTAAGATNIGGGGGGPAVARGVDLLRAQPAGAAAQRRRFLSPWF